MRCFYCSASLARWRPEDCPWEEHAKWFPECEYLQMAKGKHYVNQIQQKRKHWWKKNKSKDEDKSEPQLLTVNPISNVDPSMMDELDALKEELLCRICYIDPSDVAFIPCGHLMACGRCAANLLATSNSCPICRTDIEKYLKLFRS